MSRPITSRSMRPIPICCSSLACRRRQGSLSAGTTMFFRVPNEALRYLHTRRAAPTDADRPAAAPPDGASQLWVLRDGKPTAVLVNFGLDDGAYTEVVGGDLHPGDDLILGESRGVLENP